MRFFTQIQCYTLYKAQMTTSYYPDTELSHFGHSVFFILKKFAADKQTLVSPVPEENPGWLKL